MFTDDMPTNSLVFIARQDDIYHPERIIQHCKFSGIAVVVFEDFGHGGWILDRTATRSILDAVQKFSLCKNE